MKSQLIPDNDRIVDAFEFAYAAHKSDCRKCSTIPYIVHPLDAAFNLTPIFVKCLCPIIDTYSRYPLKSKSLVA